MRLGHIWIACLWLCVACGRLGFGARPGQSHMDAGVTPTEVDAGDVSDADHPTDAGGLDDPDAGDAATEYAGPDGSMDAAAFDAATSEAGQNDAAISGDAAPADAAPADDAAPEDAAQGDAANGDATTGDAGPSACPSALFCEDFEDGVSAISSTSTTTSRTVADSATSPSYTQVRNGTISPSTTLKNGGAIALRATTGAANVNGNEARFSTRVLGQQRSGEIWLRYYYYLPSSTVITTHISAGVVSEIVPPYDGFYLAIRPARVDLGGMAGSVPGSRALPRDRWVCIELHALLDASVGRFEAYLDGELAVSSMPSNTVPADGYTSAEVGIHYTEGSQGPVEAYVDDVVVARTRVPCLQ